MGRTIPIFQHESRWITFLTQLAEFSKSCEAVICFKRYKEGVGTYLTSFPVVSEKHLRCKIALTRKSWAWVQSSNDRVCKQHLDASHSSLSFANQPLTIFLKSVKAADYEFSKAFHEAVLFAFSFLCPIVLRCFGFNADLLLCKLRSAAFEFQGEALLVQTEKCEKRMVAGRKWACMLRIVRFHCLSYDTTATISPPPKRNEKKKKPTSFKIRSLKNCCNFSLQ